MPTIPIYYPANIPGLPGHHWSNAIAMATPIAHKGMQTGAKVIALTIVDLLTRPKLLAQAKAYFRDVQTRDQKYIPMLEQADIPAIWLNADIMAQYRPKLQKHYYDPDEYDTYLQQLGVKWPTLGKGPSE